MGNEWPLVKLESIAEVIDSRHQTPIYSGVGYPMVRVVDVKGGVLQLEDTKKVSQEVYDDFSKGRDPVAGDLVISRVGSYGNVSYVSTEEKFCLGQNTALIIPKEKNRFLYYTLISPQVKYQIEQMVVGAVQKTLSLKCIKNLDIPQPSEEIKKAIADFLSEIDDKITLNRQINQTLEQMAQTLFKSWFVDFDPVIDNTLDAGNEIPEPLQARAELRQKVRASQDFQSLPADVRALFPAEFKESELGWVPKGWMVKAADEISTISIGKTPPRVQTQWFSESHVGNVTWISIKDMGNCGVFTKGSSEYLVQEGVDKFNVKIVPKDSVILSFKLTLGRVSITSCDLTTNEAIAHFVSPKMGLTKEFIYCYLSSFDYGSLGSTSSIATAVNSKIIKQMPFIVPHIQISSLFEKKVCTFFQKLRSLAEETEALTQLRDTLLPKLISGELRLDEIPTP